MHYRLAAFSDGSCRRNRRTHGAAARLCDRREVVQRTRVSYNGETTPGLMELLGHCLSLDMVRIFSETLAAEDKISLTVYGDNNVILQYAATGEGARPEDAGAGHLVPMLAALHHRTNLLRQAGAKVSFFQAARSRNARQIRHVDAMARQRDESGADNLNEELQDALDACARLLRECRRRSSTEYTLMQRF